MGRIPRLAQPNVKVYAYKNCSTCQKALKFLHERGLPAQVVPIVEQPPSLEELTWMAEQVGSVRKLFNTSGAAYRELNMGERWQSGLSDSEALQLLAQNGKLVKRPFLVTESGGVVGFRVEEWQRLLDR